MPDPCHKCGAHVFTGALECGVCREPIRRLSAAERKAANRGPRLVAALTLVGLGVAIVLAGIVMGDSLRRHSFTVIGLGFAFIGAGITTWTSL